MLPRVVLAALVLAPLALPPAAAAETVVPLGEATLTVWLLGPEGEPRPRLPPGEAGVVRVEVAIPHGLEGEVDVELLAADAALAFDERAWRGGGSGVVAHDFAFTLGDTDAARVQMTWRVRFTPPEQSPRSADVRLEPQVGEIPRESAESRLLPGAGALVAPAAAAAALASKKLHGRARLGPP